MPGDGNCLLTSIALSQVQQIQGGNLFIKSHMLGLAVPKDHSEEVEYIRTPLRVRLVEERSSNADYYQGFLTYNITTLSCGFVQDRYFSGNAGHLMVLQLANILITILASIQNMPILCVPLTTGTTITFQPIFLAYAQTGSCHYVCAVLQGSDNNENLQ